MIYYVICSIMIIMFFIVLMKNIIADLIRIEKPFEKVLFCIFLTILFRLSWNHLFVFYGLEYEDSYAFSFLAREFAHNIYTSSFLSEGIICGSLDEPYSMGQYGGHFITYSVFLSYFVRLFGNSPFVIANVTSLLSFLSLLLLSIFPFEKKEHFWWFAPTLYCASPIINVFSNTFLCEPFSGFIVLAFLYGYFKGRGKFSLLPFVAFMLSMMCKRENLVLLIVPLLDTVMSYKKVDNKIIIYNSLLYMGSIVLYLIFVQNVFGIETTESNDIEAPTFAFNYFIKLFPVFVQSLINVKNFSIIIYFVVIYIIYLISKKELSQEKIIIGSLFVMYLLLYSSHYRGYFFVKYGQISQFETFRYLNNFFVLISLVLGDIYTQRSKRVYILSFLLLLFSFVQTTSERYGYSEEEYVSRFLNPIKVIAYVHKAGIKDPLIVSDDILVFQNLSDPSFKVCDIRFLDRLNILNKVHSPIFIQIRNNELQDLRYELKIPDKDLNPVLKLKGGVLYKYIQQH